MKFSKRELAAYHLLLSKKEWEYGEAIMYLSKQLCFPKRTSRHILKRLKKLKFIKIIKYEKYMKIVIEPPENAIENLVMGYIKKRSERCKSNRDEEGCTP